MNHQRLGGRAREIRPRVAGYDWLRRLAACRHHPDRRLVAQDLNERIAGEHHNNANTPERLQDIKSRRDSVGFVRGRICLHGTMF